MSKLFTNGTLNRGGSLSKMPGVNYKEDGTGRDTYILNNNGGLFNSYTKPLLGGISSHNALPNLRKSPPPFQAKNVNYRVDGSGRDFYIAYVTYQCLSNYLERIMVVKLTHRIRRGTSRHSLQTI